MIKDNQKYFNRLHVLLDALAVTGSYLLAWYLKFKGPFSEEGIGALPRGVYFSALYFLVPGYIILYYWYKYYSIALSKKESAIEFIKHSTLMDFYLQFLLF